MQLGRNARENMAKSSRPPSPDDEPSSLEETDRDIDPKEHDPQAEAERASSSEPQVFNPFAEEPRPASEKPESEAQATVHAWTCCNRPSEIKASTDVAWRWFEEVEGISQRFLQGRSCLQSEKDATNVVYSGSWTHKANTYFSTECAGTLVYEEVWIVARTASTDHQVHQRIFSIPGCGANHESI